MRKYNIGKEEKRVLSNFGYLGVLEMASHFFPLITTPYLARVIGVDGFGALAIGSAVIAYFQTFVNYGFNLTSVRDIARCRDDKKKISEIVSITIYAKWLLLLVSLAILLLLIWVVPFFYENRWVILCTFTMIPGTILFTDWFFQAIEDMKWITIMNITSRLIFTLFVFVVVKQPSDYLLQPILTSIGYLIPGIVSLVFIKKRFGISIKVPLLSDVIKAIKDGFNLFVTLFLPTIYSNLNMLILGSVNGKQATGIYSGGTKFTSIAYCFFQVLSRSVYPFFARKMDKHHFYVIVSLSIAAVMSSILFFFAEPIVRVFLGAEFLQTVIVLKILAFTPIAMSLTNSYGYNYLILNKKEKIMRNIVIIVTVVGILLGIPMAIYYSFMGVAITELSIQFLRGGLIAFSAIKDKMNNKNKNE